MALMERRAEEQLTGLYTLIEENLVLPFERVGLEDLPLPSPAPAGADWVAAYRQRLGDAAGLTAPRST